MSNLQAIFDKMNIPMPSLLDSDCYSIDFNGENVFANKWDGSENAGGSIVERMDSEQIKKIVTAIENVDGLVITKTDFNLIKIIDEYIVRIFYPPAAAELYISIYKTGPSNIPWPSISDIWSTGKAFVVYESKIEYSDGNTPKILPIEPTTLVELHRVFKRNAVGWFDGHGIQSNQFNVMEILTLLNGDRVTTYFKGGPVEMHYYPKYPKQRRFGDSN